MSHSSLRPSHRSAVALIGVRSVRCLMTGLLLRVQKELGRIDRIIDSSGLAVCGEGESVAAKHGGKGIRGWKKLHLGVDGDGVVVGQRLTDASVDYGRVRVGFVRG